MVEHPSLVKINYHTILQRIYVLNTLDVINIFFTPFKHGMFFNPHPYFYCIGELIYIMTYILLHGSHFFGYLSPQNKHLHTFLALITSIFILQPSKFNILMSSFLLVNLPKSCIFPNITNTGFQGSKDTTHQV